MLRMLLLDRKCWLEHMRPDSNTGSDPPGIRLRPAEGPEASDFFLQPGLIPIMGRIIEALADVGYDGANLMTASYDWRLAIDEICRRDHYYEKLKMGIELMVSTNGQKVVIVTHSQGGLVTHHFLKWVESTNKSFGGNSPGWTAKHVHAIVNTAPTYLGVPKAAPCIISGESRDTTQLGRLESFLLERLLNKRERASLFRTWLGGFSMFPKGGRRIWGDRLVNVNGRSYTPDEMKTLSALFLSPGIQERITYTSGIANPKDIAANDNDPRTWYNPLESRLPAGDYRIYSFYGHGLDTEVAFEYKEIEDSCTDDICVPWVLDTSQNDPIKRLQSGIYCSEGDGSVPLVSLGYMPAVAWRKHKHLNPSSVQTIVREYKHDPHTQAPLLESGPRASDHAGILGNTEMIEDMLKVVCDFEVEEVVDRIESEITRLNINLFD